MSPLLDSDESFELADDVKPLPDPKKKRKKKLLSQPVTHDEESSPLETKPKRLLTRKLTRAGTLRDKAEILLKEQNPARLKSLLRRANFKSKHGLGRSTALISGSMHI